MHTHEGGTGVKRNRWKLLECLEGKDMGERIEHEAELLSGRPATCSEKVALGVHVADGAGVAFEYFDDREGARIEDMDASTIRCSTYVASRTLHDGVLRIGNELRESAWLFHDAKGI